MPTASTAPARARPRWTGYAVLLVVTALAALGARAYVVQRSFIPSASMEHTLRVDDQILVDKVSYALGTPARGEIAVFRPPPEWRVPTGHDEYVKRVVGVGGDHVVCCDDRHRITVNDAPLDEDYLFPGDAPSDVPFDVRVPPGRVFLLGDHRSDSADSRAHLSEQDGTVGVDRMVGRAFVTVWPPSSVRTFGVPAAYAAVPDPR